MRKDINIKRKLRVQFDYKNVQYSLPVTDCTIEKEYLRKDCGLYPINYKPIFCVLVWENLMTDFAIN